MDDAHVQQIAQLRDDLGWADASRIALPAPAPPLETVGGGAGGIAAIAPGMEAFFEANFIPGEYVLVCMATAPDGGRTSSTG